MTGVKSELTAAQEKATLLEGQISDARKTETSLREEIVSHKAHKLELEATVASHTQVADIVNL